MKKVAVIIKHPGRDWWKDIRVDIIEVADHITHDQIHAEIVKEMNGPFEVIGITEKVNLNRKLQFLNLTINKP